MPQRTDFTIPQFSLSANQSVQRTSPAIPTASVGYQLLIQQVGWPHAGGTGLTVAIDVSYDNQATWSPLVVNEVLPDEAVPSTTLHDGTVIPADSFRVIASLNPEAGGQARFLRATVTAAKALTQSGTISAL